MIDLEPLKNILAEKLGGGQITGGAAPVLNGNVQQTASPEFIAKITGHQQPEFIDGLKQQAEAEISQPVGYEARVQNALENPIGVKPQPQTQDMSSKLATLTNNLTTGMKNLATGFQDNYDHSLMQGDLMNGVTGENKGFAQRAGELLGTAGRVIQNPAVGGLIAALVANKVNPGGGLRNAANVGLDMAKYLGNMRGNQNVLQAMGYNVPNGGIFSGVSDAAMKSTIADAYNSGRIQNGAVRNEINKQKADQKYEIDLAKIDLAKFGITEKMKAKMAELQLKERLGTASIEERSQYHNIIAHLKAQGLDLSNARFEYQQEKDKRDFEYKTQYDFQKRIDKGDVIRVVDKTTGKTGYVDRGEYNPKLYKKLQE